MGAASELFTMGSRMDQGAGSRYRLHGLKELRALPPLSWLVRGVMECASFVVLYGNPGTFKTFLALAWALSISEGRDWLGRKVKPGPVVYVCAEGGRGVGRRVEAWLKNEGLEDAPQAFFVLNPVEVKDANVRGVLVKEIEKVAPNPALIVFDTLNRCFSGEENSATEMGVLIRAAQTFQEKGTTVVFIHHAGKPRDFSESRERGSSALRAAADTMIKIEADGDRVTVICDKQKDAEPFKKIALAVEIITLGYDDEEGESITSCVLVPVDDDAEAGAALDSNLLIALQVLVGIPGMSATRKDWHAAVNAATKSDIAERTFDRRINGLKCRGLVTVLDGKRRGHYKVTEAGFAICHPPAIVSPLTVPVIPAATATPPMGWQEAGTAAGGMTETVQ
jgi:hypothetical protein